MAYHGHASSYARTHGIKHTGFDIATCAEYSDLDRDLVEFKFMPRRLLAQPIALWY